MASVRWAPGSILYLDCLEVSLLMQEELEFECMHTDISPFYTEIDLTEAP